MDVLARPGRATLTQARADPWTSSLVWRGDEPAFTAADLPAQVHRFREPAYVVLDGDRLGLATGGTAMPAEGTTGPRVVGLLPPLYPEWLGDRSFCEAHGTRFPYVAGEMAEGIATTAMVIALARADLLGFFGAAGLGIAAIEEAVGELRGALGDRPNWGVNLIHSPNEPELEERVADLLVRQRVPRISASAFLAPTAALVRCAVSGLRRGVNGQITRPTQLFAKVSRPEVAEWFLRRAPAALVAQLLGDGRITAEEAALAAEVPLAEDITVEADSGGHTDNRPLMVVLPSVLRMRDDLCRSLRYSRPIRVGAAGGLGTPEAVAAAFAAGAAYVLTGSVNQAARESGLSEDAKRMLAGADVADVIMAPAADMFEQGVRLQVLRKGTMFATRAARLYQVYRDHPSLEAIPPVVRAQLECDVLGASIDEVWTETRRFWQDRDPAEVVRAEQEPKHRMALVFRWYLGKSSRWAVEGTVARRADYQIWCGPAMGAFNRWAAVGSLADPANRSVVQIARNLLEGAAVVTRAHQARTYGVPVPAAAFTFIPRQLA